nr:14358_t:CDS:2 [Entrophospora candida]CAG8522582.1 7020_t:CDS:2 [Entrophospora candida]
MSFLQFVSKRRIDQIFLYKHLQTSQVLITIGRALQNKALDQIQDERLRPHTLRKDHWLPVVAVSGFSSYSSMITTFNKLLYNLQEAAKKKSKKKIMLNNINIAAELNNEKKIGEKTKAYQKILSRIDKKEEQFNAASGVLDNSVVNLCSILKDLSKNRLEVEGESKIKIYWERTNMSELPNLVKGLQWPNWVEHYQLLLNRSRHLKNKEFKLRKFPKALKRKKKNLKEYFKNNAAQILKEEEEKKAREKKKAAREERWKRFKEEKRM